MSLHLTGADLIARHAREYGSCAECRQSPATGATLYSLVGWLELCDECLFGVWSELEPLMEALDERDGERSDRELR